MLSCFQAPKEIICFYYTLYTACFSSAHFPVRLLKWITRSSVLYLWRCVFCTPCHVIKNTTDHDLHVFSILIFLLHLIQGLLIYPLFTYNTLSSWRGCSGVRSIFEWVDWVKQIAFCNVIALLQSVTDLSGTKRLSKREPLHADCLSWDKVSSCPSAETCIIGSPESPAWDSWDSKIMWASSFLFFLSLSLSPSPTRVLSRK